MNKHTCFIWRNTELSSFVIDLLSIENGVYPIVQLEIFVLQVLSVEFYHHMCDHQRIYPWLSDFWKEK